MPLFLCLCNEVQVTVHISHSAVSHQTVATCVLRCHLWAAKTHGMHRAKYFPCQSFVTFMQMLVFTPCFFKWAKWGSERRLFKKVTQPKAKDPGPTLKSLILAIICGSCQYMQAGRILTAMTLCPCSIFTLACLLADGGLVRTEAQVPSRHVLSMMYSPPKLPLRSSMPQRGSIVWLWAPQCAST